MRKHGPEHCVPKIGTQQSYSFLRVSSTSKAGNTVHAGQSQRALHFLCRLRILHRVKGQVRRLVPLATEWGEVVVIYLLPSPNMPPDVNAIVCILDGPALIFTIYTGNIFFQRGKEDFCFQRDFFL